MHTLRLNRPVIAVTGSAGKSTTKEMLASILSTRWRIFKSKENRNIFRDTARYAGQIKPYHQAAVLEYGMIYPGRIKRHCQYIEPNIGIITMIGSAHIGNFKGLNGLIEAKAELIRHMNQKGILFLNADDRNSRRLPVSEFGGKIIRVGIRSKADYQALRLKYRKQGMSFTVMLRGKQHGLYVPVPGVHNVYNALFAVAVADRLGFTPREIRKGLSRFRQMERRLRVYRLADRVKLIDDTFSANPGADKAAVDVLCRLGRGRKIAVLGSMLELGRFSERAHKSVGRYAVRRSVQYLATYGKGAEQIGRGAVQVGMKPAHVRHFTARSRLHRYIVSQIKPGDTILVKGSHELHMDKTVSFLRKHAVRKREDDR